MIARLFILIALVTVGSSAWKLGSVKKFSAAACAVASLLQPPLGVLAAPTGSVVVLGAGGKTGSQIVKILASEGVKVQPAYARETTNKFEGNENVYPPMVADVTKAEGLAYALSGAKAVVFAASASGKGGNAEAVDYRGVVNTANAAIEDSIPQLVVISSAAVTRPNSLGYKITNIFGGIMGYKIKGEDGLRAAYSAGNDKLSYAIVRPGGLMDGDAVGVKAVELNQGDTIAGEVNRADVAEAAAAAAISSTIPKRVTFEISELGRTAALEGGLKSKSGYEQSGKDSYDKLFEGLKPNFDRML